MFSFSQSLIHVYSIHMITVSWPKLVLYKFLLSFLFYYFIIIFYCNVKQRKDEKKDTEIKPKLMTISENITSSTWAAMRANSDLSRSRSTNSCSTCSSFSFSAFYTTKKDTKWLPGWLAWLTGRTSVSGQRSFTVLHSTCCWRVISYVGKPSNISQPTRPTQPFILSGSINE